MTDGSGGGWPIRRVLAAILVLTAAGMAETVQVRFASDGGLVLVDRPVPAGMDPAEAAVRALLTGPTAEEAATGITSAIPSGTSAVEINVVDDTMTVDLSPEAVAGLDEARLGAMFDQFRFTLFDFPEIGNVRLTCKRERLSTYLDPVVFESTPPPPPDVTTAVGLAGKNITIGPSHGRYYHTQYGWIWQRSDPCGFGEAVLEDTNSIRLMQFLYQYLTQDGATVHVPRELNESNCCHSATGLPWWKMAARYWLQHNGLPASIWDSSNTDYNDDIRARPLFADYRGSHIYIAHHTNAGGGGTASGTEVYRDTEMEHPAHVAASYNLALATKTSIEAAIRDMYDPTWPIRNGGQPRDGSGNYGEIRIPNRPACLIELAFHDNCSKDALYLTDNYFRSVSEWGVYKGVCDYFGVTPTWDKYSCELVGDTIPTEMEAGQTYNVSVTFRNRGVLWSDARNFRLGAVSDSDPFTAFSRVYIATEVRPGNTYTFNFSMTAPSTPVDYLTDWRMVRDGVTWFGPMLTKTIRVGHAPMALLTDDFESYANMTAFRAAWTDTGSSQYYLNTAFGNGGASVAMPSPSASNLGRYYRDLGRTCNGTDAGPLVFQYDLYLNPSGSPNWSGARHYCELRGYEGGGFGVGSLQNLLAIGLYNNSSDTFNTARYQGRVAGGSEWQTLDEGSAPARAGGWHKMRIEIASSEIRFYVDGILCETEVRPNADGFDSVVIGSDLTANGHLCYVDNIEVLAVPSVGDFDLDGDVDSEDFAHLQICYTGPAVAQTDPACQDARLDGDPDVDEGDFLVFQQCFSGPNLPAEPGCGL